MLMIHYAKIYLNKQKIPNQGLDVNCSMFTMFVKFGCRWNYVDIKSGTVSRFMDICLLGTISSHYLQNATETRYYNEISEYQRPRVKGNKAAQQALISQIPSRTTPKYEWYFLIKTSIKCTTRRVLAPRNSSPRK